MNMEDHIWRLATKKLSNEASEQELQELDMLLQEYPDTHDNIKRLFNWWHYDAEQNPVDRSQIIFNKIQEKIKKAKKNDLNDE